MFFNFLLIAVIVILIVRLVILSGRVKKLDTSLSQTKFRLEEKTDVGGIGEARLEAILSSMFEGVLVVDGRGKILLMNPSLKKTFLINFPVDGKIPLEVIRNASIQDIIDRTLKSKLNLISQDISLIMPEERTFKVNSVPIFRNEKIEGAILVFHDITELRRLERVRQDFVANVSHELRTPLSTIKGYAETLLEGALEDKNNAKDFLKIIYSDSDRLAKLIDDLLDLSKIESSKLKMSLKPISLAPIIEGVISGFRKQAKDKSLSMNIEIPKEISNILADENRLTQVLFNLIDNAIKYSQQGGKVVILAKDRGQFVQVDVSDNGVGIPEKDIPRIFERFYRVDKARSRQLGGTGLGLSIVKHIVQSHGGEVFVQSILAQGSTFSFTIPKASQDK